MGYISIKSYINLIGSRNEPEVVPTVQALISYHYITVYMWLLDNKKRNKAQFISCFEMHFINNSYVNSPFACKQKNFNEKLN